MTLKGKKLLVLGGAGVHCKVVEAAKEMGVYTVVADYLPIDESPAKQISDDNVLISILDVDAIVEYCKNNAIDGVINFCNDPAQRACQSICCQLGLPYFGDADQVHYLTNKHAFKKLCIENNVDVIQTYSENEALSEKAEYPIIIKPTDSRGSRGITVCSDKESVAVALNFAKHESSKGNAVIERYLGENQDLTITYLVVEGEPHLVSLGDRYHGLKEDNLDCQLSCTIQPSRYMQMYLRYVDDRVKNMIRNIGIKNGPVFMQGFVDGNTVRMYDPGIRFPGNEYERILAKVTDCNMMKAIISFALTGKITSGISNIHNCYQLNGKSIIQYMVNVRAGRISNIDGIDEVAKLPFVHDIQQKRFVGELIENTGDIKHRTIEISMVVENDLDAMQHAVSKLQSILKITDENGEDMIVSAFDLSKTVVDKEGEYYSE